MLRATGSPQRCERALADPEVNGVIVMCAPQGNARPDDMATEVVQALKTSHKPVITVLVGGDNVATGREIFKSADVPCYGTPEEAVRTYMSMYQYTRNLELLYETPAELPIDIAPPKHNLKAMLRRAAAKRTGDAHRGGVEAVHLHLRIPRGRAHDGRHR